MDAGLRFFSHMGGESQGHDLSVVHCISHGEQLHPGEVVNADIALQVSSSQVQAVQADLGLID